MKLKKTLANCGEILLATGLGGVFGAYTFVLGPLFGFMALFVGASMTQDKNTPSLLRKSAQASLLFGLIAGGACFYLNGAHWSTVTRNQWAIDRSRAHQAATESAQPTQTPAPASEPAEPEGRM